MMLLAKASSGYDFIQAEPTEFSPRTRRVVKRARRQNPLARVFWTWVVVAALTLTYVGERAVIISLAYGAGDLRAKLQAAQVDGERLQLEISQLSSLQRVEEFARAELGMVEPERVAYLDENDLPGIANTERPVDSVAGQVTVARVGNFLQSVFTSVAKAAGQ